MSGERSHEEPVRDGPTDNEERERRFRRPRFHSESDGTGSPPGDGPGSPPPDGDGAGLPPARLAGDLPLVVEPLRDLAEAFRENSETLRSLAEGQARLARRIDRSDRSEAVINSTKALNDTFRGVQRIQERLASRLESERKRPWLLMIVALGATGVVVGGILWYLLSWVDRRDRAAADRGDVAVRDVLAAEQGRTRT
jgi:hypothetical protein